MSGIFKPDVWLKEAERRRRHRSDEKWVDRIGTSVLVLGGLFFLAQLVTWAWRVGWSWSLIGGVVVGTVAATIIVYLVSKKKGEGDD